MEDSDASMSPTLSCALVTGAAGGLGAAAAQAIRASGRGLVLGDQASGGVPATVWQLTGLVNSAGVTSRTSLEETSRDEWNRVMAVNVTAIFSVVQALAPLLREATGASVVNVSSVAGLRATPRMPAYNTSKAAVIGLTRSLAMDLNEWNIRINAVCPASIDTPMSRSATAGLSVEDATEYESRHFDRQLM